MLSLTFIIAFIFCLAIAVAGIGMSRQLIQTYNGLFHKRYFYYLVTFYAFAFYGVWAHILMRILLDAIDTQNEIVSTVANFLPIFGVPFLIVSWTLLLNLGYAVTDVPVKSKKPGYLLLLFTGLITILWAVYIIVYHEDWVMGEQLVYAEIGLIQFIELILMIYLCIVGFRNSSPFKKTKKNTVRTFVIMMFLGFMVRSAIMPAFFYGIWFIPPLLLLFFLTNLFPLIYLKLKSDTLFIPVFAGSPSNKKKALLYEKFRITKREKEIVEGICKGLTNQQIADELFISLQTVKDHTHRIYSKIGINSRMKLVSMLSE